MVQTIVPMPFNGLKTVQVETGYNTEQGTSGFELISPKLVTVLAILFHLLCQGLNVGSHILVTLHKTIVSCSF